MQHDGIATLTQAEHRPLCFVATLIVKITLNVKNFTLRVNNPPLM